MKIFNTVLKALMAVSCLFCLKFTLAGQEDLFKGIYNEDINKINLALNQGADPNLENAFGEIALVEAARAGFYDIVKALLEGGADPNILNSKSEAALIEAAEENHTDIVKLLLSYKADPNIGANSWFASAFFGRLIIFYAPGIDVPDGNTALMAAASYNHLDAVIALLEGGADPNIQNSFGNTALIKAARNNRLDAVTALLERGADPNIQNNRDHTAYTVTNSLRIKKILFE